MNLRQIRMQYLKYGRYLPLPLRKLLRRFRNVVPPASSFPLDDKHRENIGGVKFQLNRSDYVQWRLCYGFNDMALREAKKRLASGTVLDVGANFGGFSLQLAASASQLQLNDFRIVAMEPNPVSIQNFETNFGLNESLQKSVTLLPFGLGDQNTKAHFQQPASNSGAARVTQQNEDSIEVQIRKLDDVVKEYSIDNVRFIKMIVEGYEWQVIKGGVEIIKRFRPALFFEVTPRWYQANGYQLEDITSFLSNLGYKFKCERNGRLVEFHKEAFATIDQYNMLATVD